RVMLIANIGHRVEALTAPRVAAAESRKREPAAPPRTIRLDGLARIVRAGGKMPAIRPDERREGQAIKRNRPEHERLGGTLAKRFDHLPVLPGRSRHALPSVNLTPRASPRSCQWPPRPRRTRAASRHGARDSRAPVRARRGRPICRTEVVLPASASCASRRPRI